MALCNYGYKQYTEPVNQVIANGIHLDNSIFTAEMELIFIVKWLALPHLTCSIISLQWLIQKLRCVGGAHGHYWTHGLLLWWGLKGAVGRCATSHRKCAKSTFLLNFFTLIDRHKCVKQRHLTKHNFSVDFFKLMGDHNYQLAAPTESTL